MHDIAFRRLTRDDFPVLARWLAAPHVARWWFHEHDPAALERDFGAAIDGEEPGEDHIVLLDGQAVGLVQFARYGDYPEEAREVGTVTHLPPGAVMVDYLIGEPERTGRGLGRAMIAAFVERIWTTEPDAGCVVVPVATANEASWRALLGAGFRIVGSGWLEPDNPVDDGHHQILRIDRPRPS